MKRTSPCAADPLFNPVSQICFHEGRCRLQGGFQGFSRLLQMEQTSPCAAGPLFKQIEF